MKKIILISLKILLFIFVTATIVISSCVLYESFILLRKTKTVIVPVWTSLDSNKYVIVKEDTLKEKSYSKVSDGIKTKKVYYWEK